jgi:hypothetical protein
MLAKRIKERRRQLDERHPPRSFCYTPKNLSVFGQDGVAITIGPRAKIPPAEELPGPGSYNPKSSSLELDIPHRIPNRPESSYFSLSSGVDFMGLRPFTRPMTRIGNRDGCLFYTPTEGPAPFFCPTPERPPAITIGPRFESTYETDVPGPGEYNDFDGVRPQSASFSMPRSAPRELWPKPPEAPGPGQYNVIPVLAKPKRWAGKLRVPADLPQRRSLAEEILALQRGKAPAKDESDGNEADAATQN